VRLKTGKKTDILCPQAIMNYEMGMGDVTLTVQMKEYYGFL
jgi:hypothetical protein